MIHNTVKLAQSIPGLKDAFESRPAAEKFSNLADVLSGLLNIAFYIGAFMAFYWLVWAAFQYILAKGDKEGLAKARSRITWAIIGLLVIVMAYLIATYASEIFPARPGPGVPSIPGGGLF